MPLERLNELTDSQRAQIDDICIEWERTADNGTPPSIQSLIPAGAPSIVRNNLLLELLMCEGEWLWQQKDSLKTSNSFLEKSLERHPDLLADSGLFYELVVDEFERRQLSTDPPTVLHYRERFREWPNIESHLRRVLSKNWPVVVWLRSNDRACGTEIDSPLLVGRQQAGDLPPPCLVRDEDGQQRLIVSERDHREVARRHVGLDYLARNRVQVTNVSRKSEISINQSRRLLSGETDCSLLPVTLHFGKIALKIQNV